MTLDEVVQRPLTELSGMIEAGEVSPVELTEAYIERAQRYERLNAYVTLDADGAMAQAREAAERIAKGKRRGPLDGLPMAVKDQLDVAGVRTTAGSRLLDYVADEDSTAVSRLREAGAVMLGKLNMSEFAMGGSVTHPYGVPHNPWDESRQAGQSSSGSGIAVAASLCAAALGGDTAGSVRGPAAWCGITGLRPTWGRVSCAGTWPLAWFFDTIGPMTKTVDDSALVFEAIAGRDERDPNTRTEPVEAFSSRDDLRGVKVGLVRESIDGGACTDEVRESMLAAVEVLREAGATVTDVSLPMFEHAGLICGGLSDAQGAFVHRQRLRKRPGDFDFASRRRLLAGALIPAPAYVKLSRMREVVRRDVLALLGEVDVLLTPTQAEVAPKLPSGTGLTDKQAVLRQFFGSRSHRAVFSLSGVPALAVPAGFSQSGLPFSLQIAGRPLAESTVFQVGQAYQQRTQWHQRRPEPGAS